MATVARPDVSPASIGHELEVDAERHPLEIGTAAVSAGTLDRSLL
jgi:hypothetical protein